VLLEGVDLVEALDEEQVGEVLDDGERIRDAAGPEGVSDAVHFRFDFAGDHRKGFEQRRGWCARVARVQCGMIRAGATKSVGRRR